MRPIEGFSGSVEELIGIITGSMALVQGVVVVQAFLTAFNATVISVDERMRDTATSFAIGLRLRAVTRMQIHDNPFGGLRL